MSASSLYAGAHVARRRAEDEERDHVDRGVALEPLPQRAHVVGRAPGDVEHAHALARDVERDEAPVVLGDGVAGRRRDRDLDDVRPGALERDGEVDACPCRPSTCATPDARSAGGPSSRSSRAVTVSSSHASPPAHPTSTRSGSGTCATAAPAALTRRMLASAGTSRVVATVSIGTRSSLAERAQARLRRLLGRVVEPAVADDDDRRGPLRGRGRERAHARRRGRCAARAPTPPRPATRPGAARAAPSPKPSTTSRAFCPLFASRAIASSRAARRGRPSSPASAIERDASARTTTRAPTALSRADTRAGRSTAPSSAATASRPVVTTARASLARAGASRRAAARGSRREDARGDRRPTGASPRWRRGASRASTGSSGARRRMRNGAWTWSSL